MVLISGVVFEIFLLMGLMFRFQPVHFEYGFAERTVVSWMITKD